MSADRLSATTVVRVTAVTLAVVATDAGAKAWAQLLPAGGVWAASGLGLELTENSGLGFGFPLPSGLALAFAAAATVAVAWWLYHACRSRSSSRWAVALLLGGALGNVLDRFGDRAVTDYVVLGPWPSFNVADVAITVGVTWLLLAQVWPKLRREAWKDELLDIVDESNSPTGEAKPRSIVHADGTSWHRTTIVWIANARGEVLCQRRSPLKDQQPGQWQSYFGGHLRSGQTYEQNAVAELHEELGLAVRASDLQPIYVRKVAEGPHFGQVYLLRWDGDVASLRFNDGEVAEVRWVPIDELQQLIAAGKFCNRFDARVADLIVKLDSLSASIASLDRRG